MFHSRREAQVRIGTSGWSYASWRGPFYPADLPHARELAYASRVFNSVELNGSFYRLQKPSTYRQWYEQTPDGFTFAVKGSRFITHNKKLGGVETPLANFFASGVLLLEGKLGPIVWQLPETARFDEGRLEAFFGLLPRDTRAAVRLANRHDVRVDAGWPTAGRRRRIRYAIEVRSNRFVVPEFVRLVRRHGVAIVVSDSADWPRMEEVTADFVYLRLHGAARTYASAYSPAALADWGRRIRRWRAGGEPADARRITDGRAPRRRRRDVYVYFDNDQHANAPLNALALADRVAPSPRPAPP